MAVINFYDDIFDVVSEVKEVESGYLRTYLEEHVENLPDKELHEVYNAETDETEYIDLEITSYKTLVIINGEERKLDYDIQPDDVISVIFIPQDAEAKQGWGTGLQIFGYIGEIVGTVLTFIPAVGAPIGMAVGALGSIIAGVGSWLYSDGLKEAAQNEDPNQKQNLPYIDGASNQSQVGNRYLSVLGKHLISPNIVGTPYHETHVKDYESQKDGGQWIKVLYCAGYGPLRLTNFKLGQTILCPNESTDAGQRRTVMHGQLAKTDYYDENENFVPGDFTVKWKNNDVKMEILQAGDYVKNWNVTDVDNDKYGTIYPQSVHEVKVGSNVLFAYDKALSDAKNDYPVLYYNKTMPSGYRTNTVRLSSSCPSRLEVELDMPEGIYSMRSEGDKDTKVKYRKIPIYVAVQWRFMKGSNQASDYNSPEGWETFDSMIFDDSEPVGPVTYTNNSRIKEIDNNKGLSENTSLDYNEKWLNSPVFNISNFENDEPYYVALSDEEILEEQQSGRLIVKNKNPKTVYRTSKGSYPYVEQTMEVPMKKPSESYPYIVTTDELAAFYSYELTDQKESAARNIFIVNGIPSHAVLPETKAYDKKEYNTVERRLVFRKDFTPEDMERMCNRGTEETYYDQIEVRVLRLTPCYLPETDKQKPFEYKDLVTWTYLRSYLFDKQKVIDKLDAGESFTTAEVISRPQPIETDLNDFCYIALSMKQDTTESVSNTLEQFSCIAESFSPKYDSATDTWWPNPNLVKESYNYCHKYKDGNDWKIDNITETEYLAGQKEDQYAYYKKRKGNNFIDLVRDEIFGYGNNLEVDGLPLVRAYLPEDLRRNCISSNTASVLAQSLMSKHLNEDAKTYDAIHLNALTEFYEFCEDVTDGTKQDYTGLNNNLKTSVDFSLWSRFHTNDEMSKAGYPGFTGEGYATIYTSTKYLPSEDAYIVWTPIYNSQTQGLNGVMPYTEFSQIENDPNTEVPAELILAKFPGSNGKYKSEYYAIAAHQISDLIYSTNPDFPFSRTELLKNMYSEARGVLDSLEDCPINAIRDGIHEDRVRHLVELMAEIDEVEPDYKYVSYYIDVLEQTLQPAQSIHYVKESDGKKHIKFECNAVLSREIKFESLLQKIVLTGRSYLKRSEDNKYEPVIGKPDPYPVTIINQRNCISRSNSRNYEELPCGFQVSLVDADDNYTTNDLYVMDNGEDFHNPSARIEPFTIDYVTNKYQAASLAKFNLACRLYQLESYSRTVGMIGHSLSMGNTVLIQDDTLLIGTDNGGRIVELIEDANKIYGFTTDEPIQYKGEVDSDGLCTQGCTILQPQQYGQSRTVTVRFEKPGISRAVNGRDYKMKKGLTNLFLLATPILKAADMQTEDIKDGDFCTVHPEVDNLVAFGNVGSITSKAVIISVKPKDKDQFELQLVPYNEELYNAGFGIPIFRDNMTNPDDDNFNFDTSVSYQDLMEKANKTERNANEYTDIQIANVDAKIIKAASPTPRLWADPALVGFAVDGSNIIPVHQTIKVKLHIQQFGSEVAFVVGDWSNVFPKEYDVSWDEDEHEFTISVNQGGRITAQNWKVPISYRQFKEKFHYGIEDEQRYVETAYVKLPTKPFNWEEEYESYFYFNGEIMVQNTSPEWKSDYYYELKINGNYGGFILEADYTEDFIQIQAVPVQGGRYLGAIASVKELNEKLAEWKAQNSGLIIGDYILWVGEEAGGPVKAIEKKDDGYFKKFHAYSYTSELEDYQWMEDSNRAHISECYNDALQNAKDQLELAKANPTMYNYFKSLYASSIVADTLVANSAFLEQILTTDLVLKERQVYDELGNAIPGEFKYGSIRSGNFDGKYDEKSHGFKGPFTEGFCLDFNGDLKAANAEIKGVITASELYIGKDNKDVDVYFADKYQGEWRSDTIYYIGEHVLYEPTGSTYTCIKTTTSAGLKPDENPEFWVMVAKQGNPNDFQGSDIYYAESNDNTMPPITESAWKDKAPENPKCNFLWTRVRTYFKYGNEPAVNYSYTTIGNVTIDLSNEMDSIPLDENGKVVCEEQYISLTTEVQLFNGVVPLEITDLVVPQDKDKIKFVKTLNEDKTKYLLEIQIYKNAEFNDDKYAFEITAKSNAGDRVAIFTIQGVRCGENALTYRIVPSYNSISRAETGTNTPGSINLAITETYGKTHNTFTAKASNWPSGYTITCTSNGVSQAIDSSGNVNVSNITSPLIIELKQGNLLIDKETIPVIKDGISAVDPVMMDLSNEMDAVSMTKDGAVIEATALHTKVSLYDGVTDVTSEVTIAVSDTSIAEYNTNTKVWDISIAKGATFTSDKKEITFSTTYKNTVYSAIMTITGVRQGVNGENAIIYQLNPSETSVRVDSSGTKSVSTITCSVTKTDGNSVSTLTTLPSGYSIVYKLNGGTDTAYTTAGVSTANMTSTIKFYLKKGNDIIDIETIPLLAEAPKISSIKPIYAFTTSGAPTQPTKNTTISASQVTTANTWSYVRPAYVSTRLYYVCYREEYTTGDPTFSTVVKDIEMETMGGSLEKGQKIYYLSTNGKGTATVPAAPTTWVTQTENVNAQWTTYHKAATADYPYLFSCTQYKTMGGTPSCTTVTIDSETIIDTTNGLIKTNLIDVDTLLARTVTLKSGGVIQSANFASTGKGFQIKADGSATFTNVTLSSYVTNTELTNKKYATKEDVTTSLGTYATKNYVSENSISSVVKSVDKNTGNVQISVTKNGTTSTATLVDTGDFLYLEKTYGTQDTGHTKNYIKIAKDGALVADNAVIHGTVYATDGEFSGELKSAKGTFSGSLSAAKGTFSGAFLTKGGITIANSLFFDGFTCSSFVNTLFNKVELFYKWDSLSYGYTLVNGFLNIACGIDLTINCHSIWFQQNSQGKYIEIYGNTDHGYNSNRYNEHVTIYPDDTKKLCYTHRKRGDKFAHEYYEQSKTKIYGQMFF